MEKTTNSMFRFFGSKSKLAKYYPKPLYGKIVEPFCGAAAYSMLHWDNEVTIVDIDPTIIGVWRYLQQASPNDIYNLPDVPNATRLEEINRFKYLAQAEKDLIGFCANGGSATPKNVSGRLNFNSWNRDRENIAKNLHKIRHWVIVGMSYEGILNFKATWFVDSPYQDKGKWYKYNSIDFPKLGEWCKSREGLTIVCENEGADWLPFEHLREIPFSHYKKSDEIRTKKTVEVVYIQEK